MFSMLPAPCALVAATMVLPASAAVSLGRSKAITMATTASSPARPSARVAGLNRRSSDFGGARRSPIGRDHRRKKAGVKSGAGERSR
jgi:hypothetical protein